MLLEHGLFPYVDSVELKAPGTFYLAWWFADGGRDIAGFQCIANIFALGSLAAVAAIAWRMWGVRAAFVAAALYGLHDAFLDSLDANYVTWAQLPQVLAFGCAAEAATRARSRRATLLLWLCAGLFGGWATLCKRPVGVVTAVIGIWALLHRQPNHPVAGGSARFFPGLAKFALDFPAAMCVVAGIACSQVPVFVHYGVNGQLSGLVDGYLLNRWGMRYLAERGSHGWAYLAREGVFATVYFLALPLLAAVAAMVAPRDPQQRARRLYLCLWAGFTLFAASLGGRFYKGYFVPVAPALCILAAAPWGVFGPGFAPGAAARLRRGVLAVVYTLAMVLAIRAGTQTLGERHARKLQHDRGGRAIATYLNQHLQPGDRIWVWGWHLWDCYAFTGALSGSTIYKSMGLLTRPNDDTWRTPASKLRMIEPSPYRKKLLTELAASRPKFIVLGSTVPRGDFHELTTFLRAHYRRDRGVRIGRVQFWRLRE